MNNYLELINRQIAAKHLLAHPFYLAWKRGELTARALADYACQYYQHVAAFPTDISAVYAPPRLRSVAMYNRALSRPVGAQAQLP